MAAPNVPAPDPTPSPEYHAFPEQLSGADHGPPAYPGDTTGVTTVDINLLGQQQQQQVPDENGERHRKLSVGSEASTPSSVNENLSVASITSSIEDRLTWRGRMQVTLHSHSFHYFIIFLVVLDAFIVLFELLLDLGAFGNIVCEGEGIVEQAEFCHFSSEFRDECGPPAIVLLEGINISASPGLGDEGICTCQFRDGQRTCVLGDKKGVNPALILHITSVLILSTFMVEIILKWVAFRLKYFLPSIHKIHGHTFYFISFEMFDGIVVVISWILDIASLQEEAAFELIDLLIILRLWRIVRVVNGAVLSAKAQLDQELFEVRHRLRHTITALHKAQDKIDLLEEDNQVLRQRAKSHPHDGEGKKPPAIIVNETGNEHHREE